jgi:ATP-dependent DNA ligase
LSKAFAVNGIEFFHAAEKAGIEGIMAKKADSTYSAGDRSKEWLKVKVERRQEVVIGALPVTPVPKSFSAHWPSVSMKRRAALYR